MLNTVIVFFGISLISANAYSVPFRCKGSIIKPFMTKQKVQKLCGTPIRESNYVTEWQDDEDKRTVFRSNTALVYSEPKGVRLKVLRFEDGKYRRQYKLDLKSSDLGLGNLCRPETLTSGMLIEEFELRCPEATQSRVVEKKQLNKGKGLNRVHIEQVSQVSIENKIFEIRFDDRQLSKLTVKE